MPSVALKLWQSPSEFDDCSSDHRGMVPVNADILGWGPMTGIAPSARKRHRLLSSAGLTDQKLASIGAVVILASHTEYFAERAIWAIEGLPIDGARPWTDGEPIIRLIDRLDRLGQQVTMPTMDVLIFEWCRSARSAFSCRNPLFHGRTQALGGEWAIFSRNDFIDGKPRKRPRSEFHATADTLGLLEEAFEHLLNGIHFITTAFEAKSPLGNTDQMISKVRAAGSIAAELDDLAAAYNHEKY